jgi:hypothetical protein
MPTLAIIIPVAYARTMAPNLFRTAYFFVSQIRKAGKTRQKTASSIRLNITVSFRKPKIEKAFRPIGSKPSKGVFILLLK